MKANSELRFASQYEYSSALEKQIGDSLQRTLAPPWSLEYPAQSVDVRTGGGQMNYTPDFLIRNSTTGNALAVELKSSSSLSIPNIIKLQHVQAALEKQGTAFLIVVHDGSRDEPVANARLGEYGINAVGVSGAVDAAGAIEKQLAT